MKNLWIIAILLTFAAFPAQPSQADDPYPFLTSGLALKELSASPLRFNEYKADSYLRAAAALPAMNKEDAGRVLLSFATKEQGYAIFILCRMLFTEKPGKEFRRPMIGAAIFYGGTKYADWSREPIALVNGVPFFIVRGYILGGFPEPPSSYVQYCLDHCDWNPERFRAQSTQEKQKALAKLLSSRKWKTRMDDYDREFFASQIR